MIRATELKHTNTYFTPAKAGIPTPSAYLIDKVQTLNCFFFTYLIFVRCLLYMVEGELHWAKALTERSAYAVWVLKLELTF